MTFLAPRTILYLLPFIFLAQIGIAQVRLGKNLRQVMGI
jgi:hypothetical protein